MPEFFNRYKMEEFSLWGAIVNMLAVIAGGGVGTVIHSFTHKKNETANDNKIGAKLADAMMIGVGLCTMLIGVQGAIKAQNILICIISMAVGALWGTLLDLDGKINRLGNFIENKTKNRFGSVSQGFVSASLLFCVGAMAVTGPLESGLTGNHSTQYAKSILDCISAVVFGSSMGFGVMLSAAFVLVYQGTITLLAGWIQPLLNPTVITEMTAVGSLLIIGISLNLLGVTKIKLMNYIPAIFMPILLCPLFTLLNL